MRDLSIIIPARNEQFLARTIQDILENIEADTEVIVLLDGQWADPPVTAHERVSIIYVNKSIGQRAGADLACSLSTARYVMKVDAHCSFDKGFDKKMIEAFKITGDKVVMAPTMRNLHVFNWRCHRCGWFQYQGPKPKRCEACQDSRYIRMKMIWVGKERPQSNSFSFDSEPHFQYFNEYKKRPEYRKALKENGLTESMSLQGSAFMSTRELYWELRLGDGELGNWGNQGIQVAGSAWLCGKKVIINHNTWYAHCFRTQQEFGFPYPLGGRETKKTKDNVRDMLWQKKHPKQIYPVSWLVERFWPVPGWTEESLAALKASEKQYQFN